MAEVERSSLNLKKPAKSQFDTAETDEPVMDEIAEQQESVVDISTETGVTNTVKADAVGEDVTARVVKTGRRFDRVPRQSHSSSTSLPSMSNQLCLHAGLDTEIELLPQKSCISPPTLAMSSFVMDNPDFDTVRKLGTGVTLDRELREMNCDEDMLDTVISIPQEEMGNSVVFHVANQIMTTQPSVKDNVEVKEKGNTRVLLTASSDQVELGNLEKESVQYNFKPGRGRPTSSSRGRGRGIQARMQGLSKGCFSWRNWRVDGNFIVGFSDYMKILVRKWNLPKNSNIDPRIQALLKEKEAVSENPDTIQKIIAFFAEVFVKVLYITFNFPTLKMDNLIDILAKHYTLENQQFATQTHSLILQEPSSGNTQLFSRGTYTQDSNNTREEDGNKSAYRQPTKQRSSVAVSVQPNGLSKITDNLHRVCSFSPANSDRIDVSCNVQVVPSGPTTPQDAVGQ